MTLRVTTEDDTLELSRVNHLVVLKNPFIASGLKLGVQLTPDDGRLCLVAITGRTPVGMLGLLPGFYSGNAIRAPGVVVRYCNRVSLEAPGPASLEFDGDPQGYLPVEIAILPAALRLLGTASAVGTPTPEAGKRERAQAPGRQGSELYGPSTGGRTP
jgi:diacylglycerol kinase family enzyme